MSAKIPWIQRTFSFDFPVGLFPDVIERFRGTPARLEDRLAGLSRDVLTRRDGDTWSIQENAGHLLDLEPLFDRRLDAFLAGAAELPPADMANRRTHEANHNGRPIVEVLQAFRRHRAAQTARLEALPEADFGRSALHPRLRTPMRLVDAVAFVSAHDDYHLARISELRRMFAGAS